MQIDLNFWTYVMILFLPVLNFALLILTVIWKKKTSEIVLPLVVQ